MAVLGRIAFGLVIKESAKIIAKHKDKLKKVLERVKKPTPKPKPKTPKDIFKRPKDVPEEWQKASSRKGDGIKYIDPKSGGSTYIRISRGKPDSTNAGQRIDYVRWQRNGKSLDKNGNVVPKNSQEAHIPLEDFKFKPELF